MINLFLELLKQLFVLMGYMSNLNSFPKQLGKKEENELLLRYKNGDEDAKNKLIEHNLRLVAHIAKKYTSIFKDCDDAISIGTIGLIKGISSYNFDKKTKLSTYISRCIENEILMAVRSGKKTQNEISIDEPIGTDSEGNQITFNDILSNDDDEILDTVNLKMVKSSLSGLLDKVLDKREKVIIILRYGLSDGVEYTQNEIAKKLKISRSYVSRIEKRALEKLGENMKDMEI
ncbi:MAG: RNA polymerase sporulation sigma factor SigK [Clostridia bacterium]|nr:RNA polymerase sporulation sigma factor SigK [Clostridia bacterium]